MSNGLEKFFNPNIQIKVNKGGKEPVKYNVDFVRYLSFAFQYYKQGAGYIAKKFARRYEDYYQTFILSVIDDKNGNHKDARFEKYDNSFLCRIDKVTDTLKSLNPVIECSIIDQDIYLCGIVYWIIMKNSSIDIDKKDELFARLNKIIFDFKKAYLHKKNPAAIKYLNERVTASISIYEEYINGEG